MPQVAAKPREFYPQARAILQLILDGFGETARDTAPIIVPCLPKSARIMRNSYNQADSWELTFDVGDLPVDPDFVRAGAVEIYLFQLAAAEQRVVSRKEPLLEPDAGASRPRDPTDTVGLEMGLATTRDRFTYGNKPQIAGLFDRDQLTLSGDGGWVTIAGQDYTAHLMATQWPPMPSGRARRIPVGQRIDDLFRDLLDEADPEGRLKIDLRGIEAHELPTVGKHEVRGNRRGIPVEQDTSYWDVLYKVAARHGLITYVDGLDVVLSRPRNLSADGARVRRLTWGVNLESLEMTRELGKQQAPTIVVRGYDPATRQVIEVQHPKGSFQRASKVGEHKSATKTSARKSKSGKVTTTVRNRDEYAIVPAYGISDRATLQRMAETRYNTHSRAERRVVARTRDLRDTRDTDMLDITAGDPALIEWDDFNRELLANPDTPTSAKVDHLVDRGFNREVAIKIADAFNRLQALQRPLRIKEATLEYDADEGVSIEMDLQDFIVVDGVRQGHGAVTSSVDRGRDARRSAGGNATGWSRDREAAELRRRGR